MATSEGTGMTAESRTRFTPSGVFARPLRGDWTISNKPIAPEKDEPHSIPMPPCTALLDTESAIKVVYGQSDTKDDPNYRSEIYAEGLRTYEEFVNQADGVRHKYEAAMREMEVRFEIIDRELELKRHRNPIHHVETRVKTPRSIYEKLLRYGKEPTIENLEKYLMDVAGVRIICSYVFDVYNMLELLEHQDDLEIIEVKDYIKHPKPNGYRSLHVIVRIPVYFMDSKQMIPVEIQFRTIAMDFWASLEHELKYKADVEVQGIDTYDELKDCSRIIEGVEKRMQVVAKAVDRASAESAENERASL